MTKNEGINTKEKKNKSINSLHRNTSIHMENTIPKNHDEQTTEKISLK